MYTIYITNLDYFLEYISDYFNILFFLSIISALYVITNNNPIVSILFLICLFAIISCYLIFIGMTFIGIAYLLVYIGAISILFLFILMLINIRVSETKFETSNSLPLGIIISVFFFISLYKLVPLNHTINYSENTLSVWDNIYLSIFDKENINYIKINEWETNLIEITHISNIGNVLYTNYYFWLMIASIILLLAMVGAIIITKK